MKDSSKKSMYGFPRVTKLGNVKDITFDAPGWVCSHVTTTRSDQGNDNGQGPNCKP